MDYMKLSDFNQRKMTEEEVMNKINKAREHNNGNLPQQRQETNPFNSSKYSDVDVPDQPVSYGNSMAESLLNNNEVPEDVRTKYWNIFHKDNVLTFLDEKRKNSKLLNFDITKIDMMNNMNYDDFTFEKEMEFNIIRNIFETKLDRALGFAGNNIKNERTVLQSQFSENRNINEEGQGGMVKEGFFKRLLGRR